MTTTLEMCELSVVFGGVHALDSVSFSVEAGQFVSLIGPNGAGKTTVVNAVTGMVRPTAGRIEHRGENISRMAAHQRAARGIIRTFQTPRLMNASTVLENIALGGHRHGRSGAVAAVIGSRRAIDDQRRTEHAVRHVAEALGLEPLLDERVQDLAGGLRRLVEVARALVAQPNILLLDEPLAGLSASESSTMLVAVRRLVENGAAALMIDHDVSSVLAVSDVITVLDRGRVLAQGAADAIQTDQRVVDAYLGNV
jgi:branched-chain amino acid transport system ATP-binding protein